MYSEIFNFQQQKIKQNKQKINKKINKKIKQKNKAKK